MATVVSVSLLLVAFCLLGLVSQAQAYCWAAGRNPGFSGPPTIEQVSLQHLFPIDRISIQKATLFFLQVKIDVVRVTWGDVVTQRECADNFVVKFWPRSAPNDYEVSTARN